MCFTLRKELAFLEDKLETKFLDLKKVFWFIWMLTCKSAKFTFKLN